VTTLDLIGSIPKFRAVLTEVAKVAPVDSAVPIQGETGTVKEVIARAIHEASPRRNHRFVALYCAAIPSALLKSELFGHERGAFTGARAQTKGRFEMAHGGTLFLDEIGDMPINSIPDEVMGVLRAHDWPGNIRELQNFIERAVLFSPGCVPRGPLASKQTVTQSAEGTSRTLADADRDHILETLSQTNWMIGGRYGAANRLGLPRTRLIYKMRKLGIKTRRSPGARPIRQFVEEQFYAAANC
jgi:transcriptional regulator with GAF, ATPase, and Fis domain